MQRQNRQESTSDTRTESTRILLPVGMLRRLWQRLPGDSCELTGSLLTLAWRAKRRVVHNRVHEYATDRIVAAVVWVFDVGVKPVVRIVFVIVLPPELTAMRTMTKKRLMQRRYKDTVKIGCDTANHFVVSGVDFQAVGPIG